MRDVTQLAVGEEGGRRKGDWHHYTARFPGSCLQTLKKGKATKRNHIYA